MLQSMQTIPPRPTAPAHGNRIRELREAAGLTQVDIAYHLRCNQSTVHRWEAGLGEIPDVRKLALARLFGVSVDWLMGWEGIAGTEPPEPKAAA